MHPPQTRASTRCAPHGAAKEARHRREPQIRITRFAIPQGPPGLDVPETRSLVQRIPQIPRPFERAETFSSLLACHGKATERRIRRRRQHASRRRSLRARRSPRAAPALPRPWLKRPQLPRRRPLRRRRRLIPRRARPRHRLMPARLRARTRGPVPRLRSHPRHRLRRRHRLRQGRAWSEPRRLMHIATFAWMNEPGGTEARPIHIDDCLKKGGTGGRLGPPSSGLQEKAPRGA